MSILLGILIFSCAVQKEPLGGPKDEDPPVLDTLKSSPNYQTFFNEKEVVLKFDEFIQLKNAFQQVVYSPPMKTKPELVQRGKKLTIKFAKEDTLRSNTTYTINFGDAIQDLNENNPLSNFRYVFSTGAVIDSLEISGNVIRDETKEPAEEIFVMLYDDLSDSIVYKEQPYYFAKTDKTGKFIIQNLRSDTFKVFLLEDGNLNLKYDEGEIIGFLDTFIMVNDSLPGPLNLHVFEPTPDLEWLDTYNEPFKLKFEFNRNPYNLRVSNSSDSIWWKEEVINDSLILWHDNTFSSDSFFLYSDSILLDTFVYNLVTATEAPTTVEPASNNLQRGKLRPGDNLEINFSYPVISIDSSLISLKDSLPLLNFKCEVDSVDLKKVSIIYPFRFGDTLDLEILPGAITLLNDNFNDTIKQKIIPDNPEAYGLIQLSLDSLNMYHQYLLELKEGNTILFSSVINDTKSFTHTFRNMTPKAYKVRVVADDNGNGRWDPGDYKLKTQSEEFQVFELEKLRENWELEAKLIWKR